MIGRFDSLLRADAPNGAFRRYNSFSEAGINIADLTYNIGQVKDLMEEYKRKLVRVMLPKFKEPTMVRAEYGHIVNTDEAIEGVAECFRRSTRKKRAPLRIGINVSRDYAAGDVSAVRGAAILAFMQLCNSRGQNVEVEVAYGNGRTAASRGLCHVRIMLLNPSVETITRVTCSDKILTEMGVKCVSPLAKIARADGGWVGYYRFREFPWKEYDFVLDRIETSNIAQEYQRILDQLEAMSLT